MTDYIRRLLVVMRCVENVQNFTAAAVWGKMDFNDLIEQPNNM